MRSTESTRRRSSSPPVRCCTGGLPRRALKLVEEWTELHRDELLGGWERAERDEPLVRIDPLPGGDVTLTYDEAMAMCLLLAEAADAVTDDDQLRDTWAEEARLMIELVLNRTDD